MAEWPWPRNREEIKRIRVELEGQLARARFEVDRVIHSIDLLESICQHPEKYKVSHMGETCWHCPDCGCWVRGNPKAAILQERVV
jgi:hypothetical protein